MSGSLVGKQLGTFRLDRLLGQGGMAAVYYGWDLQLQRPSAVKVVDTRGSRNTDYAARAMREARLAAGWRHENIVQIYYADEQDGLYYFAMEYVEGLNLEELLAQYAAAGELMPQDDVVRLGRAIATALDYAHERGVIHRDVKPANVLVAGDGRVVLTDFGLALDVAQGTRGEAFGTACYIAPEQARSSAAAVPQSDLYSLGVMLYEMLAGAVPFQDRSATCVALQHLTQPPPPPRERNPQLNAETEAVLLKALAKSPAERYQTGAALLGALEAALHAPAPACSDACGATAPEAPIMRLPALPALETPSISDLSVDDHVASFLHADQAADLDGDVRLYDPDADVIGRQLDEYRLEELLGHGGMARVYRALDVRLNRPAAVKVIDAPFRADPEYMARFEREAQAIARLDHPNIVRLYRFGEAEGLLYMAMQYIDGEDLGSLLSRLEEAHDFLDPEQAKGIIRQVGEALDYAHSLEVIHRDVKPANVMLDRYGRAILTDFGLALLTEVGTRGAAFGSPLYIAPEQVISSANVVPQSDLYALGVVLYRIFTGQLPFEAENPMDVALLRLDRPPRPPRELRPDLDPAVEAVILKAIAREVEDRYASGKELADALDQAVDAQAEHSTATAPVQELHFPVRVAPASRSAGRRAEPDDSTLARTRAAPSRPAAAEPTPAEPAAPARRQEGPRVPPLAFLAALKSLFSKKLSPLYAGIILAACLLLTIGGLGVAQLAGGLFSPADRTPTADLPTQTAVAGLPTQTAAAGHATSSPRAAPTATARPTVLPTGTPVPPTVGPTNTPAPSPIPPAVGGRLGLYRRDKEGLFVVNTAAAPLPLAPLRLGEKKGAVDGSAWEIDRLAEGDCVAVWAARGEPRLPDNVSCNLVGVVKANREKDNFWQDEFSVYYDGERVGTCDKEEDRCVVEW